MTSPEEYPETPIVFESLPEGAEHLLPDMDGGQSDEPLNIDLGPESGEGYRSPAKDDPYAEERPRAEWIHGPQRYYREGVDAGRRGGSEYGWPVIVTDAGHMLFGTPPHARDGGEVEMPYGEPLNLELFPGLAEMLAALTSGEWSKTGIGEEAPAPGATTNQKENGEQ